MKRPITTRIKAFIVAIAAAMTIGVALAATTYTDVAWRWDDSSRPADIVVSATSAEGVPISAKSIFSSTSMASREVVTKTVFSDESEPCFMEFGPVGFRVTFM